MSVVVCGRVGELVGDSSVHDQTSLFFTAVASA